MPHKPLNYCLAALIALACFSCTKTGAPGATSLPTTTADDQSATQDPLRTKIYLIAAGSHESTPNPFVLTTKNQLTFTAIFDSSCIYTTRDPNNQNDINKLFGFSDCNDHHLENSARVGWRWSNNALRLFAFVHNSGTFVFQEMTTARIGSVIKCRITCLDSTYLFEINRSVAELPRHCSGRMSRYKLFPYFGGDETAPHDIRIAINEL